jgi:hypothetical protein
MRSIGAKGGKQRAGRMEHRAGNIGQRVESIW